MLCACVCFCVLTLVCVCFRVFSMRSGIVVLGSVLGMVVLRTTYKILCGTRNGIGTRAAAYGDAGDMHEVEPLAQWEAPGDSRLPPDPGSVYTPTPNAVPPTIRRDFRDDVFYSVPSSLDPDFDSAGDSYDDPFGVGDSSGRHNERGGRNSGVGFFSFLSGAWRGSTSARRHGQDTGGEDRNRLYAL